MFVKLAFTSPTCIELGNVTILQKVYAYFKAPMEEINGLRYT